MLRPSAKSRVSIEYKLLDRNQRHTVPHLHPSPHQVSARCMVSVASSPSQIHRCPLQGTSDVCMHGARRRIHICICRRIPKLFPSQCRMRRTNRSCASPTPDTHTFPLSVHVLYKSIFKAPLKTCFLLSQSAIYAVEYYTEAFPPPSPSSFLTPKR